MNRLPEKYHIILSDQDLHYVEGINLLEKHFVEMSGNDVFESRAGAWIFWSKRGDSDINNGYYASSDQHSWCESDSVRLTLDEFVRLLPHEEEISDTNLFKFC